VRIILPATDKAVARRGATAQVEKPPRGLTVLLVEDNDHVREFARHLLDELGYRVVTAASAEEALERLGTEPVDLLFSDVVMPGLSGVELARLARERDPALPVLLASGYSEEIVGAAGADFEIVRKPYDLAGIDIALGKALEQVRAAG
jgi:CheY-like chemotaxis protein